MDYKFKGLVVVLIVLTVLIGSFSLPVKADQVVYKIPIKGTIDPGLVNLVQQGITAAQKAQAEAIIFEIDTYGGLVDSAIKIRDQILAANLPTTTYVSGRAWSAGALIALAGEELVMTPGSSIGAAETRPQEEKYISALRKEFQATAERRDRNPELAAAMVDKQLEIPDVSPAGKLLTLTAHEAVEKELADYEVADFNQLLAQQNLDQAQVREEELTRTQKLARKVTNPAVSTLLLTVGFIALAVEALVPGWGVGGTVGLLSLGLFFSSYLINGAASWGLLILFIVGVILVLLEVLVVPGLGITGLGGTVAIVSSLYFVFPSAETALTVLAATAVLSVVGIWLVVQKLGTSVFWQKISLREDQTTEAGYVSHKDQAEELVGQTGRVINTLRPAGTIKVAEERLHVVSEGDFISSGAVVEIIEVTGNRIVVRQKSKED
ncbi:NfeD family protein [Halanaerobaculum tunisiense]